MTAIDALFVAARQDRRPVFLPFMTAGLPTPQASPAVIEAMIDAGADGCEIGIPYSDPLMDGPVIQRGSDLAIQAGTTIEGSLDVIETVVEHTGTVALAMTYANPVFRRGVDWFCERLAAVGAAGLIVPDLPVEESGPLVQACRRHNLSSVQFVAPTSDQRRIEQAAAAEPGFLYAVAEMGVTGERRAASSHAERVVASIRAVTEIPIVFGVGISTPANAVAAIKAGADGVIVGSALVREVLATEGDHGAAVSATRALVGSFVDALRAG